MSWKGGGKWKSANDFYKTIEEKLSFAPLATQTRMTMIICKKNDKKLKNPSKNCFFLSFI